MPIITFIGSSEDTSKVEYPKFVTSTKFLQQLETWCLPEIEHCEGNSCSQVCKILNWNCCIAKKLTLSLIFKIQMKLGQKLGLSAYTNATMTQSHHL